MQLLTGTDFQSFIEAKKAAVVPLDAEWDVAYRPVLRRRILEAEEVLADQVNFGEVDCDTNLDLAESIPIPNVPSVVYYRNGELIAALVGAEQNVRARVERVLRGESIGYKDGLGPMQVPAPTPPAKS
jgi:thioredoxin-like negative regulator of GroEL